MLELIEHGSVYLWARARARRPEVPPEAAPSNEVEPDTIGYLLGGSRGKEEPLTLSWAHMLRMLLLVGITGAGKSTLMRRIVEAFWPQDVSVVSFDVHADFNRNWALAYAISTMAAEELRERLIVIDPTADSQYVVPINPLAGHGDPQQRAFHVLSVLRKQAKDQFGSWGVDIQQNLTFALCLLAEAGDATGESYSLADLELVFTRPNFRELLLPHASRMIRSFWEESFARLPEERQLQAWTFIQSKVTPLLLPLYDLLAPRQGFSFEVLNEPPAKFVLCTLAHHRLEDAAVSGMDLLVSSFANFVMSRA